MTYSTAYRSAFALAFVTPLMLLWMIGALGVIGSEGDRADMMYLAVFAVVIAGTVVARLQPRGMAIVFGAAAITQGLVGTIALVAGLGSVNPRLEIVGLTAMYMLMFGASAWLFQRAARLRRSGDRAV